MKRFVVSFGIIISLIFSFGYSNALTLRQIKLKLITVIAHALVKKKVVRVYVGDKSFLSKPENVDHIIFVSSCEKADMVIVKDACSLSEECKNKLIFVTNYYGFRESPVAIGALFWQKGRPVLVFKGDNLKKRHISLPREMNKYID